ncbi:ABC transporter permease [Myxococcota bacterium]|nr:ABC transporter permease [Myxococcota bacterium]
MIALETPAIAWEALRSNPVRTLLTMLGIVIGVTSVILLMSVGEGARNYLVEQFAGLGTNVLMVQPGRTKTRGFGPMSGGSEHPLSVRDAEALDRFCPSLDGVSGVVLGSVPVRHRGRTRDVMVFGVEEDYPKIRHIGADVGGFVTAADVGGRRRVAVIGRTVAKELFGQESPLGQAVTVAGSRFRVIGLIQPKGMSLGFDFDDLVLVPVTAAQDLFRTDNLLQILAHVRSADRVDQARAEIERVLRDRHGGALDFTIVSQEAMLSTFGNIARMMTFFLGVIAAISLAVGGIGIMNILLVGVGERTREIGLRKALGATRGDILAQFLIESVAIGMAGGLAGIALGVGGALLVHRIEDAIPVRIEPWVIATSFVFSAAVGVFFGVYPAKKAAALDPIEALRHE